MGEEMASSHICEIEKFCKISPGFWVQDFLVKMSQYFLNVGVLHGSTYLLARTDLPNINRGPSTVNEKRTMYYVDGPKAWSPNLIFRTFAVVALANLKSKANRFKSSLLGITMTDTDSRVCGNYILIFREWKRSTDRLTEKNTARWIDR